MLSTNPKAIKTREDRAFFASIGLCPRCGKNRLYGDERNCLECAEKQYSYNVKYRQEHPEEVKQSINRCHRSEYQKRKESGLCVRCGKRESLYNDLRCGICKEKMVLRRQERRMRDGKLTRTERLEQGLCYFCGGETVSGLKVCEKHRKICEENANKSDRAVQRQAINTLFPRKG